MKNTIIITAGGIGKRMGADTPKQFLTIKGKPIIFYTIEKFLAFDPAIEVIVTLPEAHVSTWKTLCEKTPFTARVKVVIGGKERFHSVKNGLAEAEGDIIGIHDGVRPFVDQGVIQSTFEAAKKYGAALPALGLKDSLRKKEGDKWLAKNRADYALVQTPQVFSREVILKAYQQDYIRDFTDDASVVEYAGYSVETVSGNEENIKITSPIDLKLAQLLLER